MNCPNYDNCQLIRVKGFVVSGDKREYYINAYCTDSQERWETCKRYQTHQVLHFCPDFVMPDTRLTIDQIMDHFDQTNSN
jgi:hypothetical protein